MIEFLSGVCKAKQNSNIILDVNGVGYGVEVGIATLCEIGGVGSPIQLWIETQVREDSIKLFGFLKLEEKQTFNILRSISGVGPKIALALLSALGVAAIRKAALHDRKDVFERCPGVGKRLAERLAVELRAIYEKKPRNNAATVTDPLHHVTTFEFDEFSSLELSQIEKDVESALINLGYKEREIRPVLTNLKSSGEHSTFVSMMKLALSELRESV